MSILMYNDVRQRERWQLRHQLLFALRDSHRVVRPLAPLLPFLPRIRKLLPRHQTALIVHYRWKKSRNCRFEPPVRWANQWHRLKKLTFPHLFQRRQRKIQLLPRRVLFLPLILPRRKRPFVLQSTRTQAWHRPLRPKLDLVQRRHPCPVNRTCVLQYPWVNVPELIRQLWTNYSANQVQHRSRSRRSKRWSLSKKNPIFQVNRWIRRPVNRASRRINNGRNC